MENQDITTRIAALESIVYNHKHRGYDMTPKLSSTTTTTDTTFSENFDSYTITADLDSLNGGSGFNGSWLKVGTDAMTSAAAPAGGQGGNCVTATGNIVAHYRRGLETPLAAGTISFKIRVTGDPSAGGSDIVGLNLTNGANTLMVIRLAGGNIQILDGGIGGDFNAKAVTVAAYSLDTWHTVDIDFNASTVIDSYRARVDGGTWSAFKGTFNPLVTVVAPQISFSQTNAMTFYFDDLKTI